MESYLTRIRGDGDSGVKIVRGMDTGPNNYWEAGALGSSVNAIHDQTNYAKALGLYVAVCCYSVMFVFTRAVYRESQDNFATYAYH